MLLATDLDGTFLGGDNHHRESLYQFLREHDHVTLVYVTGRGLASVMPLLENPEIPNPDYIICDVGATIVHGVTLQPIEPLQSNIEKKWPGKLRITDLLADLEGLRFQDVPQQRRCSYITDNELLADIVHERVKHLGCEVIYSAGRFLDILPAGVNKGTSLSKLIEYLGMDSTKVLVAGDTFNDFAMYTRGYQGVVVGMAEERLLDATRDLEHVYHAENAGAGGILEAIKRIWKA